ncbi:hypothetical protein Goarm_003683, partial [Gossypium armourianum]|nr:hypothetical protein [Gossypium armourianum]
GGESDGGGEEGVDVAVNEGGESDVGDEEGVREVEGKTSGNGKETILAETENESPREQFEAEVFEEVDDGNETEYFDSDDHGSIFESEDDDNTNVCRISSFRTYNPNSASPRFCIGMLFKEGEQFKSAIRKCLMCCRRELKIIRNEPNRKGQENGEG